MATTRQLLAADDIDLSAQAFWQQDAAVKDAAFAVLRRERPMSWHRPAESALMPPDEELSSGYWAVVRHSDVRTVSRNAQTYCSGEGVIFEDAPPELLEASQSFLAMDAPRHTKVRGLVNAAFTPRQVARIEQQIRDNARRVVDDLDGVDEGDFVERVAKWLPMWTIFDMIGVPEADRETAWTAADELTSWNDPEIVGDREPLEMNMNGVLTLTACALEMADHRREHPGDDLMTALVQSEVEGERLAEEEIGAFFVLLAVAGNDTTRHTTSHAVRALTEFPDQRTALLEDLDGRLEVAVEEFVRWATPVLTFRRTATCDTELGGQAVAAGDKVVMFYNSANRDESVFDAPERFDVRRDPNPHAGFGGGGPHYCLGASLARTQLRSIFGELLGRYPKIVAGEPEPLAGNFINGIKRMPCRLNGE